MVGAISEQFEKLPLYAMFGQSMSAAAFRHRHFPFHNEVKAGGEATIVNEVLPLL